MENEIAQAACDTPISVLFAFIVVKRMKERKKYGLKAARRAPQLSKR